MCIGILQLHPDTPGSEWTTVNTQQRDFHGADAQDRRTGATGGHGGGTQREARACHFNSKVSAP